MEEKAEYIGKERNKQVSIVRNTELKDLRHVMDSKEGRSVVFRLLEFTGRNKHGFTGNANQSAFNSGQRNVGLFIETELREESDDLYLLMMQEAKAENRLVFSYIGQ